jgi:hypothetical protein
MNIRRMAAALILSCAASGGAQAVWLNAQGQGQVLIYPYYSTVMGATASQITLTNNTAQAKVVRLRVAEGLNGRGVAALNIYLAPHDAWAASLAYISQSQAPWLITADTSCTFPRALPLPADGTAAARGYFPLNPTPDENGPQYVGRADEGLVEVVELASIEPGSPTYAAVTPGAGGARNCGYIVDNWMRPDGRYARDEKADMRNPTGGLSGDISLVNVYEGTRYSIAAIALEDFRADPLDQPRGRLASVARHVDPNNDGGDSRLGWALSNPLTQVAEAALPFHSANLILSYPADRAIDAVSAVLAAGRLSAPWEALPELGGVSSYVLTYPTRPYYTDPDMAGAAAPIAPFRAPFLAPTALGNGPGLAFQLRNREGEVLARSGDASACPGSCAGVNVVRTLETAVEVVMPGVDIALQRGTRLAGDLGQPAPGGAPLLLAGEGTFVIDFSNSTTGVAPLLRASLEGYRVRGLPVIGTRLGSYQNAQAQPGLLANYPAALPMSVTRCLDFAGQPCTGE